MTTSTMFTGCEGWYDTGDLARLDDDGHLFVIGCKASFVNVGGRKVNVARAERILRDSGLVRDVAVYGVDRGDGEEEIHAAVELAAGAVVADVHESCRRSLAPYEVPHVFHVVAQLPRSALGKVERSRLPTVSAPDMTRWPARPT